MPSISKRAQSMPASPLRKLVDTVKQREKDGLKVYYLNIGQPDLETPKTFYKAVKKFSDNPVEYARSQGIEESIDAWREYFSSVGIEFTNEEIMVTTGGSEALAFAFSAVADPGDEIIVFEPFYTNYNGFATLGGINLAPVTTRIEDGFHLPDDATIEAAINEKTKAIVITNPSNPTGTVYAREELQRLVDIAVKHDLFIITDEVYREIVFEGECTSLMSFPEAADRVVLVESVSKRFNICGSRIGALATHNKDVLTTAVKFGMARLSAATIEQLAVIPLLKDPKPITDPLREEYRKRRDVVFEGLQAIDGVVAKKPEGAFYIICELPVDSSEKFAKWMAEEFEHENETVLLAPASGFYVTPGKGEKEVRIAFVLDCAKLQRALELLKIAVKQYNEK
ncbi:MAG: pyridoxal phosphate-dependent aminotransferase [Candidatus Kerfeldbacteria bacterium]